VIYLQATEAAADKAGGKQTAKKRAKGETGGAAKTGKGIGASDAAKLSAVKGAKSAGVAATAEPSAEEDSDFVAPVGSGRAAAQNVKYADRSAFRGRADDWVEVAEAAVAASEQEALEKLGASAGTVGLRCANGCRAPEGRFPSPKHGIRTW
jgi:hypothetical protein